MKVILASVFLLGCATGAAVTTSPPPERSCFMRGLYDGPRGTDETKWCTTGRVLGWMLGNLPEAAVHLIPVR